MRLRDAECDHVAYCVLSTRKYAIFERRLCVNSILCAVIEQNMHALAFRLLTTGLKQQRVSEFSADFETAIL